MRHAILPIKEFILEMAQRQIICFCRGKACGVIEGETNFFVSKWAENQAKNYAYTLPAHIPLIRYFAFVYVSMRVKFILTDLR